MKQSTTKVIFMVLAFVLPISIFVFLKMFGRNEFDVPPLFVKEAPVPPEGCDHHPVFPYAVPDSIRARYQLSADSLTVIFFGQLSGEQLNQLDRVREQTTTDPVHVMQPDGPAHDTLTESIRRCIFFLDDELDVVMVDRRGVIRGQYSAADRDDIDRLLTEITILLKKY